MTTKSNIVVECPYNVTLAGALQASSGYPITLTLTVGSSDIATYTVDKTQYSFANGKFTMHGDKDEST